MANFCSTTYPWSANFGPNLTGPHLRRLLGSLPALLVDDRVDRVRRADRAGAPIGLPDPGRILGSFIWILDAAWGWSAYGFLNMRWGFHDSIAGLVVHGVAGAFTLGVLLNLGPRIGKYTRDGLARTFRPHNLHLTLMGLMLIFTGSTRSTRPALSSSRPRCRAGGTSTSTRQRSRRSPTRSRSASPAASRAATSRAGATRSGRCPAGLPA